ncbi:MAG TPA: hypothetical protein VNA17_02905 [Pyrinomonadaceae bacterium]|nr:hypothetical protein [Pyrinomonadaceae bacterium]
MNMHIDFAGADRPGHFCPFARGDALAGRAYNVGRTYCSRKCTGVCRTRRSRVTAQESDNAAIHVLLSKMNVGRTRCRALQVFVAQLEIDFLTIVVDPYFNSPLPVVETAGTSSKNDFRDLAAIDRDMVDSKEQR